MAGIRADPPHRAWAGRFIRCWESGSRHRSRPGKSSSISADLSYLPDHRIGGSIVFPGAGYVEMALAAAREIFGTGSLRRWRTSNFRNSWSSIENVACSAQVVLDPASSEFAVYASRRCVPTIPGICMRADACGKPVEPTPAEVDLAHIRRRCPDAVRSRGVLPSVCRLPAIDYGPTFQGMAQLWRGEREVLAEIHVPSGVSEQLSDYRLHPAVLDACFQSMLAAFPTWANERGPKGEILRAGEDRALRFHATPSTRLFAYARLTEFSPTELKADLQVLDEAGDCLVEVQGLVCRPTGYRARKAEQHPLRISMEAQPRETARAGRGTRITSHRRRCWLPSCRRKAKPCGSGSIALDFRTNSKRCRGRSRPPTSCARCVSWAGRRRRARRCRSRRSPIDLGIAPHYHRWLGLILKELTADEHRFDRGPAPPLEGVVGRVPGVSRRS